MGESLNMYSSLGYAYLGDAVYELYVRRYLMHSRGNMPVEKYHKIATHFVRASAQAAAIEMLMEELNEEELDVYRRGRNAKSHTVPKNANPIDYRKATGFEALIGWLHEEGRMERAEELMKKTVEFLDIEAGK